MGFAWRHTGLPVFFFFGGDHRLGSTVTGSNHQQMGATAEVNAQAHDIVVHDVNATSLWKIHLNWSVLQLNCKFKLQIQIQIKPYACLLLFTHFKMVKHKNKLHIHNPWIFLIFFHILYVNFGVQMNFLWIYEVYCIFCNFLDFFNSFNPFLFIASGWRRGDVRGSSSQWASIVSGRGV